MADTPDLGSGASACGFDAHYPHHGHRMVAYRLLISFDCHYYSQLASDGAVVLCKLGDYAAVVQWLVYQLSKLRMRFRLPFVAPISHG